MSRKKSWETQLKSLKVQLYAYNTAMQLNAIKCDWKGNLIAFCKRWYLLLSVLQERLSSAQNSMEFLVITYSFIFLQDKINHFWLFICNWDTFCKDHLFSGFGFIRNGFFWKKIHSHFLMYYNWRIFVICYI